MTKVPRGSGLYDAGITRLTFAAFDPLGMQVDCIGTTDSRRPLYGVAHGGIRGVEDGKLYATVDHLYVNEDRH